MKFQATESILFISLFVGLDVEYPKFGFLGLVMGCLDWYNCLFCYINCLGLQNLKIKITKIREQIKLNKQLSKICTNFLVMCKTTETVFFFFQIFFLNVLWSG